MTTPPPMLLDLIGLLMPGREVLAYAEVNVERGEPAFGVVALVGHAPDRPDDGPILVLCDADNDTAAVTLDRAAGEQLRDALDRWLR